MISKPFRRMNRPWPSQKHLVSTSKTYVFLLPVWLSRSHSSKTVFVWILCQFSKGHPILHISHSAMLSGTGLAEKPPVAASVKWRKKETGRLEIPRKYAKYDFIGILLMIKCLPEISQNYNIRISGRHHVIPIISIISQYISRISL